MPSSTAASEDLCNIAALSHGWQSPLRTTQRELDYRSEVESQMGDTRRDAATAARAADGQQDTVERLVVRAPVDGTVMNLAVHTVGGVVGPGERLMDLVPDRRPDRRSPLPTLYVDHVHAGLPADVRFDASADRTARPAIVGEVDGGGRRRARTREDGVVYYRVRVAVPHGETTPAGPPEDQPRDAGGRDRQDRRADHDGVPGAAAPAPPGRRAQRALTGSRGRRGVPDN